MKSNLKITLASFAAIAIFSTSTMPAFAAHEGTMMTPEQQLNALLVELSSFLGDVQMYVDNMEEMDGTTPTTNTPAADLRVVMNNLLSEHVDISADVMRKIIDGSDGLAAAKAAQLANAVEIAEAFGSLYGSEVQEAVAEAFVEHVEFSNAYAEAVDNMDERAKAAADEELDEYLNDIAMLLSSVIDGLDQATAFSVLRDHEDLMNKSAEEYKARNFTASYMTEREALKQIQVVADVLSGGIVDTMPASF